MSLSSSTVVLAIAGFVSASIFGGCSSDKPPREIPAAGSITMALKLSGNVVASSVDYKITGGVPPLAAPIVGSVDVSDPGATLTFFIGGIPAGTGYVVDLSAKSVDGKTTCGGMATFGVDAGETTSVSVVLQCRADTVVGNVAVVGTTNNCPVITSTVVAPTAINIVGRISVSATAVDLDPGDLVSLAWSAEPGRGTFTPDNAGTAKFKCQTQSTVTLTLSASDGKCTTKVNVDVVCLGFTCGNGVLEPQIGEQCEPPGTTTEGVRCSDSCQIIPVCGNGKVEAGEQCDPPGSSTSGGICNGVCRVG